MTDHANDSRDPIPKNRPGTGLRARALSVLGGSIASVLGIVAACVAFYPGNLSGDSAWQLSQAQTGKYATFHPPLMSFVWRAISLHEPGRKEQFLLQLVLLWTGLALLLSALVRSRRSGIVWTLVVGLWPPLFFAQGAIIKDATMMAALTFAVALLLRAERARRPLLWILPALPAMLYACGVRYNALAAVVPLCVWAAWNIGARHCKPRFASIATFALASLLVAMNAALPSWFVREVLRPEESYPGQSYLLHDVVGISIARGESYVPEFYREHGSNANSIAELRSLFHPHTWYTLGWGNGERRSVGFVWSQQEYAALKRAWLLAVIENPGDYVRHRLELFAALLGTRGTLAWRDLLMDAHVRPPSALNADIAKLALVLAARSESMVIFLPWVYWLAIAITTALACIFGTHSTRGFVCLLASALLYQLSYLPAAPETGFRYSWWTMLVALVLPFFVRWRRNQQ